VRRLIDMGMLGLFSNRGPEKISTTWCMLPDQMGRLAEWWEDGDTSPKSAEEPV
jgi:hypothetical protein